MLLRLLNKLARPYSAWTNLSKPCALLGNGACRIFCDNKTPPSDVNATKLEKKINLKNTPDSEFPDAGALDEYYDDWYELPSAEQVGEMRPKDVIDTPVSLSRGVRGVFDVKDLVEHLRHQNTVDIVCIRVPDNLNYVEYMVIASCKSQRHITAVSESVRQLYKARRNPQDPIPVIEGAKKKSDWLALDLINIVLHLFLPETRAYYDLESLWAVGREFDEKTRLQSGETLSGFAARHESGAWAAASENFDWDALASEVALEKSKKRGDNLGT